MDTTYRYSPRLRGIGLAIFGAVALVTFTFAIAVSGLTAGPIESRPAAAAPRTELLLPSSSFTMLLPIVYRSDPLPNPIFGVQMNVINATHGLPLVVEAHSNWARAAGVDWASVEAVQGVYNWGVLAQNETEWINASSNGLTVMLIVGHTPAWAQAYPGKACGPIRADKLAAFGNFLNALVRRYGKPPYNIRHLEIWNEPDVDPDLVPGESAFGCWGDQDDAYYGGGYFGQMLQAVYPRIKAADPRVLVQIGGLLLDCNPNNPPPGKDCKPSRFFEGIVRHSGGAYFDAVGVHGYDQYSGALGTYASPNWGSASTNTSGPTTGLEAKVQFVRGVMAAYGVTGKFVVNNESAIGLLAPNTNATYETTKAYYVARVYGAAVAEHLLANIWFSLDDDWNHQALLNSDYSPRQAYYAYKFSAEMLSNARYIQPLTGHAGVKGYVFDLRGHVLWLLWSQDGANHVLTLPSTPASIRDVDGTPLALNGNQLSLGPEPLYVEWSP